MKRNILLFFITIVWITSQCQTASHIKKIKFTSLTRGFVKKIILSPDSAITIIEDRQNNDQSHKRKLDKKEWTKLMNSIKNLSPTDLPDLKSPTMKRAYDGALHSTIVLLTDDGKEWTHSFDDEDPHERLQPLMKVISNIDKRQ